MAVVNRKLHRLVNQQNFRTCIWGKAMYQVEVVPKMVLQISLMETMARVEILLQGPQLVLVRQAGLAALAQRTLHLMHLWAPVVVKRTKPLLAVEALASQVQQGLLLWEQPCVMAMEGSLALDVDAAVSLVALVAAEIRTQCVLAAS